MSRRKTARQAQHWQIHELVVGTPSDGDRAVEAAMQIIARWAEGVPGTLSRATTKATVR
jgi:enoyl-CoA hydratase/carnithine racemase